MPKMQKIEFEFPEGTEEEPIVVEGRPRGEDGTLDVDVVKPDEEPKDEEPKDEEPENEIEIVDDTPEADRGAKISEKPEDVTEEELKGYSRKVRQRIGHMQKSYHDERRAKEAAARERDEAVVFAQRIMEENKKLKGTVGENRSAMLAQAKKAVNSELQAAKQEYKAAYEAGNADAVVEAQEKLQLASARKIQLDGIEQRAGQAATSEVQQSVTDQQQPRQPAPAPVDQKAKKWAEENTWFGTNDSMTGFALGYHTELVRDGMDPTSDEYYEKLNSRMRTAFPEAFGDANEDLDEEKPATPPKQPVAPVTRSRAPKKVTLTQTQVTLANKLGIPLEEYAKEAALLEMNKDG